MITDTTTQSLLDECDIIIQKIEVLAASLDEDNFDQAFAAYDMKHATDAVNSARFRISQSHPAEAQRPNPQLEPAGIDSP